MMNVTTLSSPSLRVGDRHLPVVLPDRRDPRLHTAAVIISVHLIGITALGFRVSVPQILSAVVAAAVVDVVFTLSKTGKLIWPASGMLTGSGVALILRLTGMEAGNFWSFNGWHFFALIAAFSVLTKYLIRFHGSHVFNPSNLGLVLAFLLLGSTVIEPLDFWWAPLDLPMALAYVVIIGGGILITQRLKLAEMAIGFWVIFAAALAVLAASGHCMTAAWSVSPVCGERFWTTLVTSPEVMIFMFFMITDPKTVPTGRLARLVFAGALALVATLLIAPQSVEFGAKVALLGSLVIFSPLRWFFDRVWTSDQVDRAGVAVLAERLVSGGRPFLNGLVIGAVGVGVAVAVIAAGSPAREEAAIAPVAAPDDYIDVDAAIIPAVVVGDDVSSLNSDIDGDLVALHLAESLAMEAEAIRSGNGALLAGASSGDRLGEMQAALDDALATGQRPAHEYRFETLDLHVAETGEGQSGAALALDGTGLVDVVVYDALGEEQSRQTNRFSATFVMRQLGSDRWLLVEVIPHR